MARVTAVEHRILTDVLAAGGTPLAVIPDIIKEGATAPKRTRSINVSDAGYSFAVPRSSPAWGSLLEERAIHTLYSDGSEEEWRVRKIEERVDASGKIGVVRCRHVGMDLLHRSDVMERIDGGRPRVDFQHEGPPSEHFGIIFGTVGGPFVTGKAPTHFAAGTISFTDEIYIRYRGMLPWDALLEIQRQTGGELYVRRNGATNWLVDLVTAVNASAPAARLEVGRSVVALAHTRDAEGQANVITPLGDRHPSAQADEGHELTISENAFVVTAVSGNDLTLAHDIVVDDDALNGLWAFDADGNGDQITDSTAPNVITVPGHAIALRETVAIRADAAGTRIIKVERPLSTALYDDKGKPYSRPDIPHVNNLVPNPFLKDWTNGGRGNPFYLPPAPAALINQPRAPTPPPIPRNRPRISRPGGGAGAGIARTDQGSLGGDDFNRANAGGLTGNWQDRDRDFRILSNKAVVNQGEFGAALFLSAGQRSEFVVRADVAAKNGQIFLLLKWIDQNNFVIAGIGNTPNQRLKIIQQVGGVQTELAVLDITDDVVGTHVLKAWIRDDDVDLWYDGGSNVSATISASLDGVAGYCGLFGDDDGAGEPEADNFHVAETNVITCTGLGTGEKIDIDGNQTTEAAGTATWNLGGVDFPLATIEILDSGGSPLVPPSGPWTPAGGIHPGDDFLKQ